MNYTKYKNSILQYHHCTKCGKVWDNYGEQVTEEHKFMYTDKQSYNVVSCICPLCENRIIYEKSKGE